MNNPIIITIEQLRYSIQTGLNFSIRTELDETGYSQMPFTLSFTMPGQRGGKYNIAVEQTYS
jgi:hypothetical protein